MEKNKRLIIRQLEAILASNQSDGYLKKAAREDLEKINPRKKTLPTKPGISMVAL
jgi:hypothetical protein